MRCIESGQSRTVLSGSGRGFSSGIYGCLPIHDCRTPIKDAGRPPGVGTVSKSHNNTFAT